MFKVNLTKCKAIGEELAKIPLNPNLSSALAPEISDPRVASLAYIYVTSICHQTEELKGKLNGEDKRGWDYLMGKFIELGRCEPESLHPSHISLISAKDLQSILSDNGRPDSSTLTRAEERAKFLQDLASTLRDEYDGDPRNLYGDGVLAGENGLYLRMKEFAAFGKDPISKKATVYFMLMNLSGIWEDFEDMSELKPMPDYHKERLFLRTGCVKVTDPEIVYNLLTRKEVSIDVDNSLRLAVGEAYKELVKHSEKSFFELEGFLWSFARSLCYKIPMCSEGLENVGNFPSYANISELTECPLLDSCEQRTEFWQPIVNTSFH